MISLDKFNCGFVINYISNAYKIITNRKLRDMKKQCRPNSESIIRALDSGSAMICFNIDF